MVVFEVSLNGQVLAAAGRDDMSLMTLNVIGAGLLGPKSGGTQLKSDGFELTLYVGGIATAVAGQRDPHLTWVPLRNLGVGDEVLLRILSAGSADEPSTARRPTEESDVDRRRWEISRDYYLKYKSRFEA